MKKVLLIMLALVALAIEGYVIFSGAAAPEVHQSWSAKLQGETKFTKVFACDGRELKPESEEAQNILKGHYEKVWVD